MHLEYTGNSTLLCGASIMRLPRRYKGSGGHRSHHSSSGATPIEPFYSTQFVSCSCRGHGHFLVIPPEPVIAVASSQVEAYARLIEYVEAGQVTEKQVVALELQIRHSHLPYETPEQVLQHICLYCAWQLLAEECETGVVAKPASIQSFGAQIAWVLHEWYTNARSDTSSYVH